MGDFPVPSTSLAAYRGTLHGAGDLVREGFWFWQLVLTDDVEIGGGTVLPKGTDGMCLFPIDGSGAPQGFPFESEIPFLAFDAPGSTRPWSVWAPVPYDRVGVVDGDAPGPMRPWCVLSVEERGLITELIRTQGSVLVADIDHKEPGPGAAGKSASVDLATDPDGMESITVSWAGDGGPGQSRFPAGETWADFGPRFAFLYRRDGHALLASREVGRIALANGPRRGEGAGCDATSLVHSFIRHWRDPEATARAALYRPSIPIRRPGR